MLTVMLRVMYDINALAKVSDIKVKKIRTRRITGISIIGLFYMYTHQPCQTKKVNF